MATRKTSARKTKTVRKSTGKKKAKPARSPAAKRSSASRASKKKAAVRKKTATVRKKKTAARASGVRRKSKPKGRAKTAREGSPLFGVSPTYLKALGEYEKAMTVFRRRDFDRAETMFQRLAQEYADEKDLADRARVYLNLSRQHTERAARLRGFDDHYNRGVYHANRGEYSDAVAMFEKALKLDPKSEKTLYGLGAALSRMGESARSMQYLRQAVELNGSNRLLARRDEDFHSLKGTPEFDELVEPLEDGPAC